MPTDHCLLPTTKHNPSRRRRKHTAAIARHKCRPARTRDECSFGSSSRTADCRSSEQRDRHPTTAPRERFPQAIARVDPPEREVVDGAVVHWCLVFGVWCLVFGVWVAFFLQTRHTKHFFSQFL